MEEKAKVEARLEENPEDPDEVQRLVERCLWGPNQLKDFAEDAMMVGISPVNRYTKYTMATWIS